MSKCFFDRPDESDEASMELIPMWQRDRIGGCFKIGDFNLKFFGSLI